MPNFITDETPPCAESDPDAFFPMDVDIHGEIVPIAKYSNEAGAKKVCSTCPYIVECLLFAVKNNEIGIWGGTTENERKEIRRGRGVKILRGLNISSIKHS